MYMASSRSDRIFSTVAPSRISTVGRYPFGGLGAARAMRRPVRSDCLS
jgi:hypothetical protein